MTNNRYGRMTRLRQIAGACCVMFVIAGCDDFVTVDNRNIVEGGGIDPATDGPMIAWSAFQDFVASFGVIGLNTAFFTTEAYTGDSSQGRSELGRRALDPANVGGWAELARGLASSENAIDILIEAPNADRNIHLARVYLSAGYAYLLMAETFCVGTVRGGPPLTTPQMLDRAIDRLSKARTVGTAEGSAAGVAIARAAAVGVGRAHLQAGNNALAIQAVQDVPTNFEFLLYTADDPANRPRLGNNYWQATVERAALVVPPAYRDRADSGDPRISYVDTGVRAYDGFLQMYAQRKYSGWAAPYRLASGLLARYIEIEAGNNEGAMQTFVNERRAAGGLEPVTLSGDALLTEFLWQKSLDFWLEAVRMGDFRRHGALLPELIPSGAPFYKPAAGPVGDDQCVPLPLTETTTNPHFK